MKNYFIGILLLAVVAASCRKVDDSSVFNKSPDQRLTETLAAYQAKLSGEKNGWKALVYTKTGGIYSFYFKFNDSNRVQMLSSFDSTSAVTLKESSFRIKALQQPSLIFDTYSYLHVLADPNPEVNGGEVGSGLQSDFEFYFDDSTTTDNQITLIGRFNGSKAVLTRATAPEATAFANGELASALNLNKILTYFKRIVINGTDSADIQVNTLGGLITKVDAQGNLVDTSLQSSYYLTLGGLTLIRPIRIGSQSISQISNFNYNSATSVITAKINNLDVVIKGVVVPMKVDVGAPKRWWDYSVSQASYWASATGFHVNGVDDAYRWTAVPGYGFIYFKAKYGTSGGVTYDLLGPVVNNGLNYGAAYRPPNFTADGRLQYTLFGILGTVPPAVNGNFGGLITKMAEAGGFYFVQITDDGLVYDMVSATDGKSWIRWEW